MILNPSWFDFDVHASSIPFKNMEPLGGSSHDLDTWLNYGDRKPPK